MTLGYLLCIIFYQVYRNTMTCITKEIDRLYKLAVKGYLIVACIFWYIIYSDIILSKTRYMCKKIIIVPRIALTPWGLVTPHGAMDLGQYSALRISRGHFSPNNSRITTIARPKGRGMGVFQELEVWSKFYLRIYCIVCNIVLYHTVIYRESMVLAQLLVCSLAATNLYLIEVHLLPIRFPETYRSIPLRWRHNERDGVSNHRRIDCLLNRSSRCKSKKISKLHVTGLYAGNSPVTDEFLAQRANNAQNVSIWLRHHVSISLRHHYVIMLNAFLGWGLLKLRCWFSVEDISGFAKIPVCQIPCISFIFNRRRHNLAAATLVKYESGIQ